MDKIDSSVADGYPNISSFVRFSETDYPNIAPGKVVDVSTKNVYVTVPDVGHVMNNAIYTNIWKSADEFDDIDKRIIFVKKKFLHHMKNIVANGSEG